jgi:hypothetical protein
MDLTDLFASWERDDRTTSKIFYEKADKIGQCGEALTTTEFDAEKKLIEETGEIPTREKIHAKIREITLDWTPPANRSDSSCIHEPWEEFVSDEIFMNTGQKPTVGEVHKFVHEKRHYPLINELHVSPAHEEILKILQKNKAISETPEFGSVRYTSLYPPVYWNTERCRHFRALYNIHSDIAHDAHTQGITNVEVAKIKELVKMHNVEGDVYCVKEEYWLALKEHVLFTDHCVYSVINRPLANFILQCSEAKAFKPDLLLIPSYLTNDSRHVKCVKCGAFESVTCLSCKASKCRKCNEQGICSSCGKGCLCFQCGGAWSCDECGEQICLECLSSLEPHEIECLQCVWRIVFNLR